MDEPLGALDKQLREHMQFEIKHLHERLGVTVVYVTHDQSEALTMSDRVAVFNDGRIQQLAPPEDLYERPENSFVAQFIGENNTLQGVVETLAEGRCTVRLSGGEVIDALPVNVSRPGDRTQVSVRPERIEFRKERLSTATHTLSAEVLEFIYMGDSFRTRMRVAGNDELHHEMPQRRRPAPPRTRRAAGDRLAAARLPCAGRGVSRSAIGSTGNIARRNDVSNTQQESICMKFRLLLTTSRPGCGRAGRRPVATAPRR